MRTKILLFCLFVPAAWISFPGCENQAKSGPEKETTYSSTQPDRQALVKRGEYLVNAVGCNDCHTPKVFGPNGEIKFDETRILSGHPSGLKNPAFNMADVGPGKWVMFNEHFTSAVGPWGVSYSANLTPDESGLGSWNEEQFLRAIRQGKYKGLETGRPLMPPMPWEVYRNFSNEDLRSIFAYLQTVKPVRNVVPSYTPLQAVTMN